MGFTCKIAFSIDEKIIHSILNKSTQQKFIKNFKLIIKFFK